MSKKGIVLYKMIPENENPEYITQNGVKYYRKHRDQRNVNGAGWPMQPCESSGVPAHQAQELRDFYKRHNFSIDVTDKGKPIYRSARHQKEALKLRGMVNFDSV